MSGKYMRWMPEQREMLLKLRREGLSREEIAERMGLPLKKIDSAYSMIRLGNWGADVQGEFNGTNIVLRKAAEAKARGLSYGQAQVEKLCEQMTRIELPDGTNTDDSQPIDMITAVDILIACAKRFGMDSLIETKGSKTYDRAAITFALGAHVYALQIFGVQE